MRQSFIKMEFYETYYYANVISNILFDPFPYIRSIHSWYEDNEDNVFLPSFPKWNRLQQFCAHVIDSLIFEEISDITIDAVVNSPGYEVWIDRAMKFHNFEYTGFRRWLAQSSISYDDLNEDHLADYHNEEYLSGSLEDLITHLSNETFHVLFSNRKLLATLNEMLARTSFTFYQQVSTENLAYFSSPGKLKRVTMPEWVKKAVFFRDRGMCTICNKDISGLVGTQPDKHYDHMIPLALGGLNDVTNIQLLCETCNLEKSSKPYENSSLYESWY